MIAAGLHPRVIQSRMGHASIVETMGTYSQLIPDGDDATRQALDELLGSRQPDDAGDASGCAAQATRCSS